MSQLFIRNLNCVIIPVGEGAWGHSAKGRRPGGAEVFLSNNRPVAGYTPELGWFKTDAPKRGNINKHIGRYLTGIDECSIVKQEFIDNLLRGE